MGRLRNVFTDVRESASNISVYVHFQLPEVYEKDEQYDIEITAIYTQPHRLTHDSTLKQTVK